MPLIADLFLRLEPAKNVVRYMCKKSCLRLPFQKEDGERVWTLLKSERQHLCQIYWSIRGQLTCKKSLLMICKILRLFVNTLSAVDKCCFYCKDNLMQPIQMQLSEKLKTFSSFSLHFRSVSQILDIFRKKMTLIAYLFVRLRAAKNVVRYICKSPASDYPSKRTMVNASQLCLNLRDSSSTIFIDQGEGNWVAKSLF